MRAVESLSSEQLIAFLVKQRWFAAKGADARGARIERVIPLGWGDGAFAIARVDLDVGTSTQSYQMPIGARSSAATGIPERSVIARPTTGNGPPLVIYDAVYDAEFLRGLVDALASGVTAKGDDARWIVETESDARRVLVPGLTSRVGSAEQSNTSIVVGDVAILKLFRTLKAGVHPDVEVTRFLTTHAGFANTPKLLGSIRLETGAEVMTAGMLQAFMPGSTDAWSYALERGRAYFAAPVDRDAPNAFLDDAKRLGRITRALHDALASDDDDPAFAPEPIAGEDVDRWAHRTQQMIREALSLLERQLAASEFPRDRLAEAQALVRRREHYLAWVNEIDDALGDDLGMRTRAHGDYHLGQVLHTASNEFMIIDFEGEPSRSLDERREKTSPLRDVAGMLRSFAYAAATLAKSVEKQTDSRTRELRAARWERDVRAAYLSGYLELADEDAADFLPEDEKHVRQMIALFETEKVFYELAYELNNRPDWVGIPMRGISKLLVSG